MVQFRDYYEVLGVARTATADEIQKAYRKLARKYHPDLNKEKDAESRFKEINEAHEVLSDPEKRKRYDALGANYRNGQDFQPPPGWESRGGNVRFSFGSGPEGAGDMGGFSDFFEAIFGGGGFGGSGMQFGEGGSPFGQAARGRGQAGRPARREAELQVSVEDAFNGATKTVQLRSEGTKNEDKTLKIKIPSGTRDGNTIRLAGKDGDEDLYLKIKIAPHARYSIADDGLLVRLPVTPWEAALGAKVDLELPDGTIKIAVPTGAQSGSRLRLRGRGFPARSGERGDVLVEIKVVVPTDLSSAEREMFEKLAEVSKFNPRAAA